MSAPEIEKSKAHILAHVVEYVPNSVTSRTILRKTTGNISIVAIDSGAGLLEKISPFDTFIQVIDGKAEMVIEGNSNILEKGQGIIIPAHAANKINAKENLKIILTIIKSGYEEEI